MRAAGSDRQDDGENGDAAQDIEREVRRQVALCVQDAMDRRLRHWGIACALMGAAAVLFAFICAAATYVAANSAGATLLRAAADHRGNLEQVVSGGQRDIETAQRQVNEEHERIQKTADRAIAEIGRARDVVDRYINQGGVEQLRKEAQTKAQALAGLNTAKLGADVTAKTTQLAAVDVAKLQNQFAALSAALAKVDVPGLVKMYEERKAQLAATDTVALKKTFDQKNAVVAAINHEAVAKQILEKAAKVNAVDPAALAAAYKTRIDALGKIDLKPLLATMQAKKQTLDLVLAQQLKIQYDVKVKALGGADLKPLADQAKAAVAQATQAKAALDKLAAQATQLIAKLTAAAAKKK